MEILDMVKTAMRIQHNSLDDDLTRLIEAAKLDLTESGVQAPEDGKDAVYNTAIELYVKAMTDYRGDQSFYFSRYKLIKDTLSLRKGYRIV